MLTRCAKTRYWGTSETLLPVYQDASKAVAKHADVDTVVNFASSRSVYTSTMELMEFPQIKTIAIIAEGVPERVRKTVPVQPWTATDVTDAEST
jgi:ATP citrate (pro-S)-lyase